MNDHYGGGVGDLPRSMVEVVWASRRPMWVARPGLRLLDFPDHQEADRASLQRFPQERDASIVWASVPPALVISSGRDDERAIADYLREDGDVIVMWDSLALPSVLLSAAEAAARVPEIVATAALLWLYRPDRDLILERNYFEDTVTVARIPRPG
ncbi:hypothetical protein ACTI_67980 [Actinoplanes sp. OR16]|uniref:hypothetical protein n=1 Tax=Actinoplanes sp. OR16 TaxID=946334 RepID=UPI000F6FA733|nr:hypothetical protein [Actinoplanes sp. OR16]BBH70113.1 hypothetical protein ACTI_67980 [Actinoplanes sp. OR16]